MGTIGEAVRRRRSALRSGLTGRFLDLGLIVVVAAFLILLATRVLEHGPSFFLQLLTFAIANGGIYALIAVGYPMVYRIIGPIHLAHGDVLAFGAVRRASLIPVFGLGEATPVGRPPVLALFGAFVDTI